MLPKRRVLLAEKFSDRADNRGGRAGGAKHKIYQILPFFNRNTIHMVIAQKFLQGMKDFVF